MSSEPILQTLAKLVELYDGVTEVSDSQSLRVLLTENIAKALSVDSEVTFSTKADVPNSYFVSYHSELLNKLASLLSCRGSVTALGVKYDGYLKTTGFEKMVISKIVPQNGLIRYLEASPSMTRYLWCHVAYTANADEKRIGMVDFMINELTGVTPVEIGDALLWISDRVPVNNDDIKLEMSADELSSLIENTAALLVKDDLNNWYNKLSRALKRDEERLNSYYESISQEIQRKIVSKGLEDEDKEKELARIDATNRELFRKKADVRERYALQVDAYLHSVMIIHLPTVHIKCELTRKKAKRVVTLVWNPFTKNIEPLRCEVTGTPVCSFYLDDRHAKIISPTVWGTL